MSPKQPASHDTAPQPETNLALSELHLLLQSLEAEHQWLLKQIKRKRTELNNFVEQLRSVATEMFHRVTPALEKLLELDREIHVLFNEILTTKKLGKQAQKYILEIYHNLQMTGTIGPQPEDEEEEAELDEMFDSHEGEEDFSGNYTNSSQDRSPFPGAETPRDDEVRKIRQTFLRLAEIFHPDKVNDPESQMRHTEIMKEINRAYQEGDLARLLEIEQKHAAGEILDGNSEDDVSRRCKKLEQQNALLKNQYENLKRELRLAKNTPEGAMVSDYRKGKRKGIDPLQQMLSETERGLAVTEEIRDFVRDFRDKKISLRKFLEGPKCLQFMRNSALEELLEEMFGISYR